MVLVRNKLKRRVQSFNGGQNSNAEPSLVKAPYASLVQNARIDQAGRASQIEGSTRIGDNPDTLIMDGSFASSAFVDKDGSIDSDNVTETSISYDDGKFGKAAQFNGTTSNVLIDSSETEISVNTMGPFCLTAYIYVSSDGENNTGRIIDKFSGTDVGYRFWVHTESSSTVKLSFEVGHGTTNALVITSTTMSINEWHKVEAHYNADKSVDIIIDGVIASYGTDTTGVGSANDDSAVDFYIGNNSAGTATFDGAMEQVRVYDGARTSIEYEMHKIVTVKRYKVGDTEDKIYRIRNKYLESLDDNAKGWTRENAGDGFEATTADKFTSLVQGKDLLFVLNGEDNVHSINSSGAITDEGNTNSDAPRTTLGAWAQNNRMFLSGSLTDSERDFVWFSDSLDPQTYDRAVNVFKVRSGSGGKVTGLKPFKLNELIIYKEDSIFDLNMTGATPLTDWTLQPINDEIGSKSPNAIVNLGNDQLFLDSEGKVRLLNRTVFDKLRTNIISEPIQDILNDINIDAIDKASAVLNDSKVYLSFPTGTNTENNRMVIYDLEAAKLSGRPEAGWVITPENERYASSFTTFEFGDNTKRVAYGDSRDINTVHKIEGNLVDEKIIEMRLAAHAHDLGNRDTYKIWGPLHVVWNAGEATSIEMFANIDEQGFISLGTLDLTGGAPQLQIDLPFNLKGSNKVTDIFQVKQVGRGKTCRIEGRHNQYNQTATLIEYELYATERTPKP